MQGYKLTMFFSPNPSQYQVVSIYVMDELAYNVHEAGCNSTPINTYEVYGERVGTIPQPHTYVP